MSARIGPRRSLSLIVIIAVSALGLRSGAAQSPATHDLPKWETAQEKNLSAAQYLKNAAFRTANPTMYAITDPPVTPVMLYAEFAPVDTVYYVWFPGTQDNFYAAMTDALQQHTSVTIGMLVEGSTHQSQLTTEIQSHGLTLSQISFIDLSPYPNYSTYVIDSIWTVDFGPFFVLDGAGTVSILDPR
jgi:hypothetical protein